MKKTTIAVCAALAALAGCQSGSGKSAKAAPAPAKPSSAESYQQPSQAQVKAKPAPAAGQQSGGLGSSSQDPAVASDNRLSSTPADIAGSGDQAASATSSGTSATPADIGAPSASASTPASDEKSDDQRGKVLTNEGAIAPKGQSEAGSQSGSPGSPSMDDAASSAAASSLHIDHAGSATAQPAIGDAATLGETENDRNLVMRIRQQVVDDETISPQGRSVQIQSQDGQIVLKGQVGSLRERQRIGDTAFRESGGKLVINQLEVAR